MKDWVLGGPWRLETASANMVFASSANVGLPPKGPSDSDSESYDMEYDPADTPNVLLVT